MIKIITIMILFTISTPIMAGSCFPLYEAEASQIRKDKAYTERIGGSLYVNNGQLGYWPGLEVPGKIDNWAQDFVDAIKWGHISILSGEESERGVWLNTLGKSIRKDCPLPDDNHSTLRKMLTELMEDGSFCPNSEIVKPKFLKGKSDFKDILKTAVKDQRFVEFCQGRSVADDSFRDVKDLDQKQAPSAVKKASGKQ
jgi:hypothetical protein